MADIVVGQREAAAWAAYHGSKPEDNIHDDYWLLNRLSKGKAFVGFDGGSKITGAIEYALNPNVEWISDYQTLATSRPDTFDEFQLNWKQIGGTVPISSQEEAENGGSARKFNLKSAKLQNLSDTMRSLLNEGCYATGTGSSNKEFGGLQHIVSSTPTTGTVHGINRATYTFFRNQQNSGAQSSTAFDNLRSAMRTNYNNCSQGVASDHPEFAVTTQTVFQGYEGILIANERFTSKDSGDGGFKGEVLKFKGAMIAYDRDCPSATMYFLNSKFLKLGYLNGYWMKGYPAVEPANQFITVFKSETKANLFSPNPRRLGVVTSIS
jgi:hypothetical protein